MAKHRASPELVFPQPVAMKISGPDKPYDVKSEFLTRDDEIGIGRRAVRGSMLETEVELKDLRAKSHDPYAPAYRYLLPSHIQEIRDSVRDLNTYETEFINRKLAGTYMKNALFHYAEDSNNTDLTRNELGERLDEKNKDGKYVIDDTTVVNFAEWYMSHTLQRQTEMDEQGSTIRRQFKDRVQHAIVEWGLPRAASQQFRHIDTVDILEDDMFVMRTNNNAAGLYWFASVRKPRPRIMLSPLDQDRMSREHIITHELSHALSDDPEAIHNRGTLFVELFGSKGGEVMNEALTEHLAVSLMYGDFDSIRPTDRKNTGAYELYREFLDALANLGQVKIDIREFYDALYFTQQDSFNQYKDGEKTQSLFNKLGIAYPGLSIYNRILNLHTDSDLQILMNDMYFSRAIAMHQTQSNDHQLIAAAQSWGSEFDEK